MFLSYLTNIPPESLLVMSGFPPLKQAYHLPRFHVDVPTSFPIIFKKADGQLVEIVEVKNEKFPSSDLGPLMFKSTKGFRLFESLMLR